MRGKGKLATWNDEKGFGFIEPFDGGQRLFIHISAFARPARRPEAGRVVTYTISADEQGRPRAEKATMAGDAIPNVRRPKRRMPKERKQKRGGRAIAALVSTSFFLVLVVAVFAAGAPFILVPGYLVASAVTYAAYAIDKSAAQSGRWRMPEGSLLLLTLAGGWPGGLLARHVLRHKTRKQPFRMLFWMALLGNIVALFALLTFDAKSMLVSLTGSAF